MKRLNPNTGKPFRRGDVREDGKVFKNYSGKILLSGFEGEAWVTPEELAKLREHRRSYSGSKDSYTIRRDKVKKNQLGKKRLNPKTNQNFKVGYKDPITNKVFRGYELDRVLSSGFFAERWSLEATYLRAKKIKSEHRKRFLQTASLTDKIKISAQKAKQRAERKNQEFSVSADYLVSIFPYNSKCPVLGIKMTFGGDRDSSPSLDRINNAKGYIEGNVVWMSYRANFIKGNSLAHEIIALAEWVKDQSCKS